MTDYKDDFLLYQAVLMVNTHLNPVEPISQATYRIGKGEPTQIWLLSRENVGYRVTKPQYSKLL